MSAAASRLANLLSLLSRRRADAFVCSRMSDIRYLTGFGGSDAVLLVSRAGVLFVTDGRYDEQARQEVEGAEIVVSDRKWTEIARRIRTLKASRVGFDPRAISVDVFRRAARGMEPRWVPMPGAVETLRSRKDGGEVRAMGRAAVLASGAVLKVLSDGVAGRAEAEVAADIEREMIRLGADGPSFRTIVAAGARSALPHAAPTGARIGRGDVLLVDFGARFRGYCSDETITLLPKRPPPPLRRAFDAVRRAQDAGIRAVRSGLPCRDVDARVRETLDRFGYLKYFVHSTGHGVGLDVHERPSLSPRSGDRLREGMVVTVEPGVYLPGVGGIRLEDMLLVGDRGAERMTYLPKENTQRGLEG